VRHFASPRYRLPQRLIPAPRALAQVVDLKPITMHYQLYQGHRHGKLNRRLDVYLVFSDPLVCGNLIVHAPRWVPMLLPHHTTILALPRLTISNYHTNTEFDYLVHNQQKS